MANRRDIAAFLNRNGLRTVAVVDSQWGDTGKGKIVHRVASEWAEIVARGTGGANAGHTIYHRRRKWVFHLLPCGILYDDKGMLSVIGRGVAVDPRALAKELNMLKEAGKTWKGLRVSHKAHLVLPHHIALDRLKDGVKAGQIGTTGRGMGPVYEAHVGRKGLTVNDLLNPDVFEQKLRAALKAVLPLLRTFDEKALHDVLHCDLLGNGAFYHKKNVFNVKKIVKAYLRYSKMFKKAIVDTDKLMREALGKKNILLEGAQGVLLSVDYGTYPYVTSSDCSLEGLARGVGLQKSDVNYVFNVLKAPYMTRVGKGPFPTELGGRRSEDWCNNPSRTSGDEEQCFVGASLTDTDDFALGVAIRRAGAEYGATTGRPRRTGWLDLPLLRHAIQYSGDHLTLTKVDVLTGCRNIKICTRYRYDGPDHWVGDRLLKNGSILEVAEMEREVMERCTALYLELPGWSKPITEARRKEDLPVAVLHLIKFIESKTGAWVDMISVGPKADQTILMRP